jgi:hypothetical protein
VADRGAVEARCALFERLDPAELPEWLAEEVSV